MIAELPIVLVGSVAHICEQLEEHRQRWGFRYIVIHVRDESDAEAFAPIVAALHGR
jgi:hypothetical protein